MEAASMHDDQPETCSLAVASLVLSLFPCIPTGILAFIFGFMARNKIRRYRGALTGNGIALAGVIISGLGLIVQGVFLIFYFAALWAVVRSKTG
jgi:hypothetical protein